MEAIILAGGLGTRLRESVQDLPKCLAPIQPQTPFLYYLLLYLKKQGVKNLIFSVGYLHEKIQAWAKNENIEKDFNVIYSIENEPLGTGGGVKLAFKHTTQKQVLVINGDTFFEVNLTQLHHQHQHQHADITLSLRPMTHFDRYGTVTLNPKNKQIAAFNEKKYTENGLINGGIYCFNQQIFENISLPPIFSLEQDFLEPQIQKINIQGFISNTYFIDIGIPTDYHKAQLELPPLFSHAF